MCIANLYFHEQHTFTVTGQKYFSTTSDLVKFKNQVIDPLALMWNGLKTIQCQLTLILVRKVTMSNMKKTKVCSKTTAKYKINMLIKLTVKSPKKPWLQSLWCF